MKSSSHEGELNEFLESLISSKLMDRRFVRIPRKELVQLIKHYVGRSLNSRDPLVMLEGWEPLLNKPRMLGDYVAKYNLFTEALTVQWVPTWANLVWAAELRNNNLRNELRDAINHLTFEEFEYFMRQVFVRTTWAKDIRVTKSTRDDGIDFEGRFVERQSRLELPLIGQAKHWRTEVGSEPIRTFLGSLVLKSKNLPAVGIYVSTTGFSEPALASLRKSPYKILWYDVAGLVSLMVESRIGVSKVSASGMRLDEGFWEDIRA